MDRTEGDTVEFSPSLETQPPDLRTPPEPRLPSALKNVKQRRRASALLRQKYPVVVYGGQAMLLRRACEIAGVDFSTVAERLRAGLSLEAALSEP